MIGDYITYMHKNLVYLSLYYLTPLINSSTKLWLAVLTSGEPENGLEQNYI